MATKPTILPRWANVGASVTEPSSGQKDVGYDGGDRPPHQYENWRAEVIYDWTKWLDDGLLTRDTVADKSPILTTTNRAGNPMHYLGPQGYWMGPAVQEQYRFGPVQPGTFTVGSSISKGDVLKALIIDSGSSALVSSSAGCSSPCLVIDGGTTSPDGVLVSVEDIPPITNLDDTIIVMSGRVKFASITSADDVYFGLHDLRQSGGLGGNLALMVDAACDGCFFDLPFASTNLRVRCFSNGVSNTVASTGVTVVTNQWYDYRVEYHGADSTLGANNSSNPVARFFVDGVMTNEVTGTSVPPNSAKLGGMLCTRKQGGGTSAFVTFATVKLAWCDTLTANAPA